MPRAPWDRLPTSPLPRRTLGLLPLLHQALHLPEFQKVWVPEEV